MNRIIRFRTWDRKARQMIYPQAVAFYSKECKFPAWKTPFEDCIGLSEDDDNDDVMQFTGLLDIERKEIYEGDILLYSGTTGIRYLFLVVWSKNYACFYGKQITEKEGFKEIGDDNFVEYNFTEWGSSQLPLSIGCLREICSVIGNSFENPELLKS